MKINNISFGNNEKISSIVPLLFNLLPQKIEKTLENNLFNSIVGYYFGGKQKEKRGNVNNLCEPLLKKHK